LKFLNFLFGIRFFTWSFVQGGGKQDFLLGSLSKGEGKQDFLLGSLSKGEESKIFYLVLCPRGGRRGIQGEIKPRAHNFSIFRVRVNFLERTREINRSLSLCIQDGRFPEGSSYHCGGFGSDSFDNLRGNLTQHHGEGLIGEGVRDPKDIR
jgi:hypothetical protein